MIRHVLVVGAGRLGAELASLLTERGHEVTVLDDRAELVAAVGRDVPAATVHHGPVADVVTLEAAAVRRADVVAAVTADDARNLAVCALARVAFDVPRTLARVADPATAWLYVEAMGVDVALNQADLLAHLAVVELSADEMSAWVAPR